MWWWMHDGSVGNWGWMVAIGWVWMLIFWGAVIALVVWIVRRLSAPGIGPSNARPTPLEIAKERYARGEITREEFESLKRDLV